MRTSDFVNTTRSKTRLGSCASKSGLLVGHGSVVEVVVVVVEVEVVVEIIVVVVVRFTERVPVYQSPHHQRSGPTTVRTDSSK